MKRTLHLVIALFAALPAFAVADTAPIRATPIPERELTCVLGRSTNLDPSKNQKIEEIVSEGRHVFSIRLPAKSIVATAEPDPSDAPDPVDVRTAILSDPDGLARDVPARFDRVVDLWPKRVEMVTNVNPPLVNLVIISAIDPKAATAHLFMTKARDAATLDLDHVYQGDCIIKTISVKRVRG